MERDYDIGSLANLPVDRPYKGGPSTIIDGVRYVPFEFPNIASRVYVPAVALRIWLPVEPRTDSVVVVDSVAWQRIGNAWGAAGSTKFATWEQLYRNGNGNVEILLQT